MSANLSRMTDLATEQSRHNMRLRLIQHRTLREARDLDIAAAARAGIGASEIARLVGLDRRHVSAIVKRIREQREPTENYE